jgi:aryl-alcohol dehydrogenase-like predicted oxidoreductase
MAARKFGRAGLSVSPLGFGAGHIGGAEMSDGDAARLLGVVLDRGITLIDTARSYGLSEERIGRHLAHRRSEFVLSTKGGYGIDGAADWTPEAITRGIDEALTRLKTDVLDVFHLHSCPADVLPRVAGALVRAREAGKIRVAAYSGEEEGLLAALEYPDAGLFGSVQCSVNLFDQASLDRLLPWGRARGMGIIAKRPIGNAPWRFADRPVGDYAECYWERMNALERAGKELRGVDFELALPAGPDAWLETALRFAAFAPGVGSAIVGTKSEAHLAASVRAVEKGPLPAEVVLAWRGAFRASDRGWRGQV